MKKIVFLMLAFQFVFGEEIYASFNVEAVKQSKLSLESVGLVSEIFVEVGQKVKKGELLLSLDTKSEIIAVQNAELSYKLALVEFQNIQSKMEKIKEVKAVIDKQSYEDMRTRFDAANLNLQKAKVNVEYAKNILSKKELRAPYNGIIAKKFVEVAEGVGGVAQPLMEIFSYPQSKLVLSFDEKYKDKVKIGDEFLYKFEQNSTEFKGKISLIYPSIEVKTRKIYAEVETSNLTPGLFGEGRILTKD